MNKEQAIDMFTMRVNGSTFQEIGEKYGVSRQAVQDYLKRAAGGRKAKSERYEKRSALTRYMDENGLTVTGLAEIIGTSRENLAAFITCRTNSVKTINKLIKATGLTYEQIMSEELRKENA